ncbi:MAG: hypothetical protein ACHQT6_12420 [Candidatus Acidiferrales bacterium]
MKKFLFVTALVACAAMLVSVSFAQDASKRIAPLARVHADATERTQEQMDAYEATHPVVQEAIAPFRPTMGDTEYRMLKAGLDAQAKTAAGNKAQSFQSPVPLHGVTGATKYTGGDSSGNASLGQPHWVPPDTEGAIGATQFVQTANDYINVYNKAGVLLTHRSLNAFFGASTDTFDPRVTWDALWQRWVVTADSFAVSSTEQDFYWAVSKTNNADGPWYVYKWNTSGITGAGSLWDFPSVALQQDAMVVTANVFGTSSFKGAYLMGIPKAQIYNGRGVYWFVYGGLWATLQPSKVLPNDETGIDWLAAAANGGIEMYALENPGTESTEVLAGPYAVTGVPAYSAPPSAVQPAPCGGGTNALDTSDARFVNIGTQYGDLLYQVHSYNFVTATIRYYVISGLGSFAPTVHETHYFYGDPSALSDDFNASIAADTSDNLVITWTSNYSAGYNAQVRYVGRQHGDPAISGAAGAVLTGSGSCMTADYDPNFGIQRWGDYSATTLDPVTAKTFWIINEDIIGGDWGNEIGKVHF